MYLAGLNSTTIPLPEAGSEVKASKETVEQLKACAKAMMTNAPGKEADVLREGLVSYFKLLVKGHS